RLFRSFGTLALKAGLADAVRERVVLRLGRGERLSSNKERREEGDRSKRSDPLHGRSPAARVTPPHLPALLRMLPHQPPGFHDPQIKKRNFSTGCCGVMNRPTPPVEARSWTG